MGQSERAANLADDSTILLVGTGRLCDQLFAALETLGMDVERASAEVASAAYRAVAPNLCVITDDVSAGGGKGGLVRLLEEQAGTESPTVFITENSHANLPQKYTRGGTVTLSPSLPVLELADQIINIAGNLTGSRGQVSNRKASNEASAPISGVIPIDIHALFNSLPVSLEAPDPLRLTPRAQVVDSSSAAFNSMSLPDPAVASPPVIRSLRAVYRPLQHENMGNSPSNPPEALFIANESTETLARNAGIRPALNATLATLLHGLTQYRPSSWSRPIEVAVKYSHATGRRFISFTGQLFKRLNVSLHDLSNTYHTRVKLSKSNVFVIGTILGLLIVGSSVLAISISSSTDRGAKVKPVPLQKRALAAVPKLPPRPLIRTETVPSIVTAEKQDSVANVESDEPLLDEGAEPEEPQPNADSNPKVTKKSVIGRVGASSRSKRASLPNKNSKQREQHQQLAKAYKLIREGNQLLKDNRLGMAEASYLKALKAKPNYPRAMASLVRVHLRRGDGNEAARWAKRLNKIQPKNSTNRRLLADALALQNNKSPTRKVKPTL
jgi:hypothetical protein